MALRAMGLVDLRPGFDQGPILCPGTLCDRQCTENDFFSHSYGKAKTKMELCPRTALGMDFCVSPSGPAVTD